MIKSNELRIGNWIKKEIWYKKTIEYYQIKPSHFCNHKMQSFTPIPITEQWLLKFGFKEINVRDIKYYVLHGISLISDGANGYLIQLGKGFTVYIDKVHQLQNLFFALTQKELEIKE